ncbi:hypothetical protein Poly41_36580 [Novipirellula artificiosorum]|uniref:Uncharacterized protein n=1 Tax=Novipirellula artificiosorum TaxID=2528016 RepID=A0A5C6DLV9_9BACT|nr:hypothetical protein Poly41_36580 [Novipirellula artificiosorum]
MSLCYAILDSVFDPRIPILQDHDSGNGRILKLSPQQKSTPYQRSKSGGHCEREQRGKTPKTLPRAFVDASLIRES